MLRKKWCWELVNTRLSYGTQNNKNCQLVLANAMQGKGHTSSRIGRRPEPVHKKESEKMLL